MKSSHSPQSRRIAICGGGTAGHITPGIAIAQAYRAFLPGTETMFLGHADDFCQQLVAEAGFEWETVKAAPWSEQKLWTKLSSMVNTIPGVLRSRRLLRERNTELAIGLGGYASLSGVLAAKTLGIPVVVFEANAEPGLANKILAKITDVVLLGDQSSGQGFGRHQSIQTIGTPVRRDVLNIAEATANHRDKSEVHILVTGGSLGSGFLNENVPGLLKSITTAERPVHVTHQAGRGTTELIQHNYDSLGIQSRVVSHLDDMAAVYSKTDFVIAAGGAITLAELNSLNLPTLVVPLVWASHDHQAENAEAFCNGHRHRIWARESEWNQDRLASKILEILQNKSSNDGEGQMPSADTGRLIVERLEQLLESRVSP